MPTTFGMLTLDTISQLRTAQVSDGQLVLVLGAATYGDGLGGFYRWVAGSSATEDANPYFNVITSSVAGANGRWIRTFQRVRILGGGNILVTNGGFKTLFCSGVTDANGRIALNLTEDGTATGTPLFATIMMTSGEGIAVQTDPNNVLIGGRYAITSDMRTLTYQFARGNSSTLSLLGITVLGMRAAATGTAVAVRIDGM